MNTSICQNVKVVRLQNLYTNCATLVQFMWGYVIPVLAVFVIIINSLIVIVLSKPHVRSHTTLILILIACTDTLNIVFPTVSYIYNYTTGHFKSYLNYSSCRWTYILADVFVDMFNMISLWLTVLLAFIRCRCLRSPFKARHIHSYRNIIIYLMVILLLAIFVHVPSFFHFKFTPVAVEDGGSNTTVIACAVSEADNNVLPECMTRKIHILLETLIDSLIPCVILITCNISILITLRKARRDRDFLRDRSASKGFQRKSERQIANSSIIGNKLDLSHKLCLENSTNTPLEKSVAKSATALIGGNSTVNNSGQSIQPLLSRSQQQNELKKANRISDSSFDKLDRESRRTTWLIFIIVSIILSHEMPLVIANIYNLAKHLNGPMPLMYHGCLNMIFSVWQYLTYPTIFLIYAYMSGSFRTEFVNTVSSSCNKRNTSTRDSSKMFLSPCSVRKSFRPVIEIQ